MPNDPPFCRCQQIFVAAYHAALRLAITIIGDFHAAQDAVQDAAMVLCNKEREGMEISEPFFLGIVRNTALNARREMLRRLKIGESESDFGDDDSSVPFLDTISDAKTPHPDEEAQLHGKLALVERMLEWLDNLNPRGAAILRLRYLKDSSVSETEENLDLSEDAVKSASARCRTLLRTHFRKEYDVLFH